MQRKDFGLEGKVAVITGSGQGLGRAIAISLANEGVKVVTNSRRPGTSGGDAETTAEAIRASGNEAVAVFADVSNYDDVKRLIGSAVDQFSSVDILINNAGVDAPKMIWNMEEDEWDRCLSATLKGSFNCSRFASVMMREKKWGRIINTTSTAWLGTVGHVNYGAAKAGIIGLTRAIARELGRYGVTCNAFTPLAATRMTDNQKVKDGLKKRFESGLITAEQYETATHMPPAEGVAPMIVYLASEKAANINGQVFHIEAGKIGYYSEPSLISTTYRDYAQHGYFDLESLDRLVPAILSGVYENPSPPK
ncbi:beta-ketoacyl-ACP reductase [Desulfosarcina ovata subsp. sediminis]|uniref:Beta-ketoacyl-ACP reductase n=1 Tax=Desulfosarcina ovata subsp. sediminis TaxID=885957 RepID=A0A5K7ZFZ9_9BACT|nr:SDR family NAD(P)-dependent oxidoreductase [Desulfosarcina ovata]BBO81002.1 beta-ketoacyl-ACP reductase [Desulfosarcina ovata subsp. sediminis]